MKFRMFAWLWAAALMAVMMSLSPAPLLAATTGSVTVSPVITETATTDLGETATWKFGTAWSKSFTSGTGTDQASKVFQDSVTLAGSGAQTYDLDGTLTGPLASISFTRIYGILVRRTDTPVASTQDENINVGGDFILTKFLTPGGDTLANVTVPIRPGGLFIYISPDSTGTAITATTGDQLTLTNASSADSVTFHILILGS